MPLTDLKIRSLKPKAKPYKTSDSDGLYLTTTPAGSKLWRFDYSFAGKRKTLSIGQYPLIPLIEARRLHKEARVKLSNGIDPSGQKRKAPGIAPGVRDSFREVADRWFMKNEHEWVTAHSVRIQNRLVADVFPHLGHLPIAEIKPRDVLDVIRRVEDRGSISMARRIYQTVGKIFRFAVSESLIPSDPTRDIADALANPKAVVHHNSLPAAELPELIDRIYRGHGELISALGVVFTIHTMVRTNETRFAQWHEFEGLDGANPLWRISGERMKMRRDHQVPLTPQVLQILGRLREINGQSQWVFKTPGRQDKPMSQNAMIYFLYRLGYSGRSTVHGMRSSASTWLNEHEFNRDWIELQLAHVDGSVRGVYNAALYLRQRREMLQTWSDFLEPPSATDDFDDIL
ncbi:integrase arm-type DNA-binding domain-containing protein [Paracoccus sp. (in: a-proteobacteria)]|uniref:tyrosine-type recombinase/integrase n=1 Tax=Paracoccus sp. TaxID=267 RepID=UPI0026DFEDE5|nr:integrase arm-type DNA-binding domain-containing protein [Paracoccus sp. (in: a-proteobacteria)]MDO5646316.1 integrase arm-type DNA-binding domain-containing protein [Paracoccus sp. (in: a-proteobacteria)]